MIRLIVMGTGDGPTMMLAERGRRAVARSGSAAAHFDYVEVGERDRLNGVSKLPALVVDGRVVSQGTVPKMREIEEALRYALDHAYPDDLKVRTQEAAPRCGGCGRNCLLTAPKCRIGRERAAEMGIATTR